MLGLFFLYICSFLRIYGRGDCHFFSGFREQLISSIFILSFYIYLFFLSTDGRIWEEKSTNQLQRLICKSWRDEVQQSVRIIIYFCTGVFSFVFGISCHSFAASEGLAEHVLTMTYVFPAHRLQVRRITRFSFH